jgi:hypothetical protein
MIFTLMTKIYVKKKEEIIRGKQYKENRKYSQKMKIQREENTKTTKAPPKDTSPPKSWTKTSNNIENKLTREEVK